LNWNESFAWPADRILCTLVGACVPYLEETFCCVLGGRTYRGVPYLEETFCCALSLARRGTPMKTIRLFVHVCVWFGQVWSQIIGVICKLVNYGLFQLQKKASGRGSQISLSSSVYSTRTSSCLTILVMFWHASPHNA
jgi:hypothetical protein